MPVAGISIGLAALFTLLAWWTSTGVILYLDGLPRATYRVSFSAAGAIAVCALYGGGVWAQRTDVAACYGAFTCSLLVWGWVEMGFLMGYIVGPRDGACPPHARGWRRTSAAVAAILYHELALLGALVLLGALSWRAPNPLAFWTFAVLWLCRLSAKLNLFLGARNFNEQFLPVRLRYIASYFRRRAMNPLFPFSVTVSTCASALLWHSAAQADSEGTRVAQALLASLVTLGTLEHWFLILPIPSEKLWKWSQNRHTEQPVRIGEGTAHSSGLL